MTLKLHSCCHSFGLEEGSDLVVEYLTRYRGVAGWRHWLGFLSKNLYPLLNTDSTKANLTLLKIVDWDVMIQIKSIFGVKKL